MKRFPNAFVIILSVILFAWILTFIIPQGNYKREINTENNRTVVVPNSYEKLEAPSLSAFDALLTIPKGIAGRADLIVLDPPRTGAGEVVVKQMIKFKPRKIIYVACDPAALARDSKTLLDLGYKLDHISGYDLFPMTQHIECVAGFSPANG